jgi:hypothetical protein
MVRWTRVVLLLCCVALAFYLISYISRLPESNCTTAPISDVWSSDRAYQATLLKKSCNSGETIFYSVRIDKPGAWCLRMEIEQDPSPDQAFEPTMTWNSRRLEIDVPSSTLSGSIDRRENDLTIVRSYTRPKP